jgi:hypothetical protein
VSRLGSAGRARVERYSRVIGTTHFSKYRALVGNQKRRESSYSFVPGTTIATHGWCPRPVTGRAHGGEDSPLWARWLCGAGPGSIYIHLGSLPAPRGLYSVLVAKTRRNYFYEVIPNFFYPLGSLLPGITRHGHHIGLQIRFQSRTALEQESERTKLVCILIDTNRRKGGLWKFMPHSPRADE